MENEYTMIWLSLDFFSDLNVDFVAEIYILNSNYKN